MREDQSRGLVVIGQIYDAGMGYRLLCARESPSSPGLVTSGVQLSISSLRLHGKYSGGAKEERSVSTLFSDSLQEHSSCRLRDILQMSVE